MASGLLLGLLVGGPGLFPTYFASARATCTPPTAFVSSALRLVKGYKLPPAALEEKVTFTIWPKTSHVPEVVHRASGSGVRSSSFVDGAEIFAGKDAEMAVPGTLQAAIAQDFMQTMLHFLGSICSSSHALQDVLDDFSRFDSVAPFYSPRFSPSLENKSNKMISMTKHDVDTFALLCEPLRMMSDVLVIPDEGGHNVSTSYESFPPRKPPGKSPEACKMMSKKQYKFRQAIARRPG